MWIAKTTPVKYKIAGLVHTLQFKKNGVVKIVVLTQTPLLEE